MRLNCMSQGNPCLIKFPFKRKACQVYRVGKGRGRGRAGQGRVGSVLSHLGSRWFVYAFYECTVFAPIVIQ